MGLQWDKPSTNWCRISSIHRHMTLPTKLQNWLWAKNTVFPNGGNCNPMWSKHCQYCQAVCGVWICRASFWLADLFFTTLVCEGFKSVTKRREMRELGLKLGNYNNFWQSKLLKKIGSPTSDISDAHNLSISIYLVNSLRQFFKAYGLRYNLISNTDWGTEFHHPHQTLDIWHLTNGISIF